MNGKALLGGGGIAVLQAGAGTAASVHSTLLSQTFSSQPFSSEVSLPSSQRRVTVVLWQAGDGGRIPVSPVSPVVVTES